MHIAPVPESLATAHSILAPCTQLACGAQYVSPSNIVPQGGTVDPAFVATFGALYPVAGDPVVNNRLPGLVCSAGARIQAFIV